MGKFKYVAKTKGEFIDGPEKDRLIAENEPFEIVGIRYKEKGKFGPQHYLQVRLINEEDLKTMTFSSDGTVFTRDDLLDQAMEYLAENKGETLIARLSEEGNSKLITIEDD